MGTTNGLIIFSESKACGKHYLPKIGVKILFRLDKFLGKNLFNCLLKPNFRDQNLNHFGGYQIGAGHVGLVENSDAAPLNDVQVVIAPRIVPI